MIQFFEVFEEKEEDQQPEKAAPHTIPFKAMKAIFDNLTSGADKRTEFEYSINSSTRCEADFIEVSEISKAKHSNACHRLG